MIICLNDTQTECRNTFRPVIKIDLRFQRFVRFIRLSHNGMDIIRMSEILCHLPEYKLFSFLMLTECKIILWVVTFYFIQVDVDYSDSHPLFLALTSYCFIMFDMVLGALTCPCQ